MTPFTTIGVTWFIVLAAGLVASGRMRYDQACAIFATFPLLISASGEKRVLAKSRLYVGQSPAGVFAVCATRAGSTAIEASKATEFDLIVRTVYQRIQSHTH